MQETLKNNIQSGEQKLLTLKMYINGEWVDTASGARRDIVNPANGEVIAQAVEGTQADVDVAVQAAKHAFMMVAGGEHLLLNEHVYSLS